jgi:hypothetical protein
MKTLKNWKIEKLSWDDDRAQGYYNPPYILTYNGMEVVIGAGSSDTLNLFEDGQYIVLLTINTRHDYAGVNVYNAHLEEIGDCFFQSDYDFMAMMDIDDPYRAINKFFGYSPINQAKILLQYVEY